MELLQRQITQITIQGRDEAVDLTDINKYVGYQSKNLKVTLTKTGGYLKKLVNEVTMIQRTMFPVRFYSFD